MHLCGCAACLRIFVSLCLYASESQFSVPARLYLRVNASCACASRSLLPWGLALESHYAYTTAAQSSHECMHRHNSSAHFAPPLPAPTDSPLSPEFLNSTSFRPTPAEPSQASGHTAEGLVLGVGSRGLSSKRLQICKRARPLAHTLTQARAKGCTHPITHSLTR